MKQEQQNPKKGWWNIRFRMKWPENAEPLWHIDLLVAHEIIAPVLYQYRKDIELWRFHRRAARDQEGHQLSFVFYSTSKTAFQVSNSVKSDTLLRKMKRTKVITQDIYEVSDSVGAPNIQDTSDRRWSPALQKSWPHYIMGSSQMWLSFIHEIVTNTMMKQKPTSQRKFIDFYQQVNEKVKKAWQEEGSHALLHHLNAVFGYEPLFVHEVILKRF